MPTKPSHGKLKFDPVRYISRGLFLALRDDKNEYAAGISSCFVSSSRGAFCTNLTDGYLTAQASYADENGKDVVVLTMPDTKTRTRALADKAVRAWIKSENVRQVLLDAVESRQRTRVSDN